MKLAKRNSNEQPWAMLTAYDALMARQVENGGADLILVGDSLGKAVLGYEGVEEVTLEDMVYHCKAVCRGRKSIPVIGDLPVNSYNTIEQALNSSQKILETGADFVKLEGFLPDTIRTLSNKKISVVAHLGHTPQTDHPTGSKVKANRIEAAEQLLQECIQLEKAGAVAIVLEMVAREAAKVISDSISIPVIGIGAGPDVDGQVLVVTDMWGESDVQFKFLEKFGQVEEHKTTAVQNYVNAVHQLNYPTDQNSFHLKKSELDTWLSKHS